MAKAAWTKQQKVIAAAGGAAALAFLLSRIGLAAEGNSGSGEGIEFGGLEYTIVVDDGRGFGVFDKFHSVPLMAVVAIHSDRIKVGLTALGQDDRINVDASEASSEKVEAILEAIEKGAPGVPVSVI